MVMVVVDDGSEEPGLGPVHGPSITLVTPT